MPKCPGLAPPPNFDELDEIAQQRQRGKSFVGLAVRHDGVYGHG